MDKSFIHGTLALSSVLLPALLDDFLWQILAFLSRLFALVSLVSHPGTMVVGYIVPARTLPLRNRQFFDTAHRC